MRTRTVLSTAVGVLGIALLAAGRAGAAERSLLGITLGRSYRTVLAKYGNPTFITPFLIPTGTAPQMAAQYGGAGGFGGQPGYGGEMGAPGGMGMGPGGPGGPGMMGGSGGMGMGPGGPGGPGMMSGMAPGGPGMMGGSGGSGGMMGRRGMMGGSGGMGMGPGGPGGGPPVLPSMGGGFPGAPGGGPGEPGGFPGGPGMGGAPGADTSGFGGQQGGSGVANASLWTYRRPGGLTMEFLINEDGLVAQISVAGLKGPARTAKGIGLGSDFKTVLLHYASPEEYMISSVANAGVPNAPYSAVVKSNGQVTQLFYPKRHHAAFTLLNNKVVRITIALAG